MIFRFYQLVEDKTDVGKSGDSVAAFTYVATPIFISFLGILTHQSHIDETS